MGTHRRTFLGKESSADTCSTCIYKPNVLSCPNGSHPPPPGELELGLELDDVGVYESKHHSGKSVLQSEKMTQTEVALIDRAQRQAITPNGTSPCNHPSLTCQVNRERSQLNV